MQEHGVDISPHRVKMINRSLVDDARKIILFCEPELIRPDLSELLVYQKDRQYIPIKDPYTNGNLKTEEELKDKFRYTRDKIEEVIRKMFHIP
jgi:protein-tyrosine-phosphatase